MKEYCKNIFKGRLGKVFTSIGKKKFAFTLAEVLITLGIIGVVAALTMPVLIQKYQERVLVVKAKKAYSVIMNALNRYNLDNEAFGNYAVLMDSSKTSGVILEEFSKYFNVVKICKTKKECGLDYHISFVFKDVYDSPFASVFTPSFITNDGMVVGLVRETTRSGGCYYIWDKPQYDEDGNKNGTTPTESSRCGRIRIDTNGKKGPNRLGSDVFTFQIYSNKITFSDTEGNLNYVLEKDKIVPVP